MSSRLRTTDKKSPCALEFSDAVFVSFGISISKRLNVRQRSLITESLTSESADPCAILSGIQPSGALHIGNYFGMMQPAIALQAEGEALYFIADYHALTSVRDPEVATREQPARGARFSGVWTRSRARDAFSAFGCSASDRAGLDPVDGSADGFAGTRPFLQRQTRPRDCPPLSDLFSYPVLMAADILIYDSDVVPVGKDQKQHIEITRDLAVKMNETFGPRVLQVAGTAHPGRDRNRARDRRPENE